MSILKPKSATTRPIVDFNYLFFKQNNIKKAEQTTKSVVVGQDWVTAEERLNSFKCGS